MNRLLERLAWQRAQGKCEYCQMPHEYDELPFEVDHILARKHGGATDAQNLALACFLCNNRKGPDIAGRDPRTERIVRLFHPRRDKGNRHFQWDGASLTALTPIGRATIVVLEINLPNRVGLRQSLIEENIFPPKAATRQPRQHLRLTTR